MWRISNALLLVLCVIFVVAPVLGQQPSIVLKMDQMMTAEELRTTGVDGLTHGQRVALDAWLNRYTLRVLTAGSGNATGTTATNRRTGEYTGVGNGHWIKTKSDNGAFVTLEDGSLWEINSIDRIDTSLWLPITDITVILSHDPIGDYKYELIDTEGGEKALSKYVGRE